MLVCVNSVNLTASNKGIPPIVLRVKSARIMPRCKQPKKDSTWQARQRCLVAKIRTISISDVLNPFLPNFPAKFLNFEFRVNGFFFSLFTSRHNSSVFDAKHDRRDPLIPAAAHKKTVHQPSVKVRHVNIAAVFIARISYYVLLMCVG